MHLCPPSLTGRGYVFPSDVPPLTRPSASRAAFSGLSQALAVGKKFRYVPLGAGIGAVTAGVILLQNPDLLPAALSRWTVIGMAAGAGVVVERLLNYSVGRWVDPLLRHWGSKWETKLELAKLKQYLALGLISEQDGKKIAARIARRDVAGGPRPVRNRPATYRKRRPQPLPPSPPSAPGEPRPPAPPLESQS
jgi:hypothetical protein